MYSSHVGSYLAPMFLRLVFAGCQEAPPSSLRKTPAAEIATHIRAAFAGSRTIEWVIRPPAPGNQRSRVGWVSEGDVLLPGLAAVVRAEERARVDAAVDDAALVLAAGLDAPEPFDACRRSPQGTSARSGFRAQVSPRSRRSERCACRTRGRSPSRRASRRAGRWSRG